MDDSVSTYDRTPSTLAGYSEPLPRDLIAVVGSMVRRFNNNGSDGAVNIGCMALRLSKEARTDSREILASVATLEIQNTLANKRLQDAERSEA